MPKPSASLKRVDLSRNVSEAIAVPLAEGEELVEAIVAAMTRALHGGDEIEIRRFGCFRIRQRRPRTGRNPMTGVAVEVPPKKVIYFKPGKEILQSLNPPQT